MTADGWRLARDIVATTGAAIAAAARHRADATLTILPPDLAAGAVTEVRKAEAALRALREAIELPAEEAA